MSKPLRTLHVKEIDPIIVGPSPDGDLSKIHFAQEEIDNLPTDLWNCPREIKYIVKRTRKTMKHSGHIHGSGEVLSEVIIPAPPGAWKPAMHEFAPFPLLTLQTTHVHSSECKAASFEYSDDLQMWRFHASPNWHGRDQ